MIVLRNKEFSWFNFGKKKPNFDELIRERYDWVLDYSKKVDEQLEKENDTLYRIDGGSGTLSDYFYFHTLANDCCSLTDFLVDFNPNESWVGNIKPKYIKYSPDDDRLYLREGWPIAWSMDHSKDKVVKEIKDKKDLQSAYRLYFTDLAQALRQVSLLGFERMVTGGDEDLLSEIPGGKTTIQKYYKELSRFISSIKL